ncbi:MAG TPA: hypothetical protein VF169_12550 [Albitalea sp.]
MNVLSTVPCQCANCPGSSCDCGCAAGSAPSTSSAACACAGRCGCDAAEPGCLCTPSQS